MEPTEDGVQGWLGDLLAGAESTALAEDDRAARHEEIFSLMWIKDTTKRASSTA